MARRVQVQGDLFHGRIPDGAVYVGRPAPGLPGSRWANPYRIGKPTPATVLLGGLRWTLAVAGRIPVDAAQAVDWYRMLVDHTGLHDVVSAELGGRDLACWCRTGPCHADALLEILAGAVR